MLNTPVVNHPRIGKTPRMNFHTVRDNRGLFVFSYRTCIAFEGYVFGLWVKIRRENDWGPTTGKHMHWVENNLNQRNDYELLSGAEFEKLLTDVLKED
jgi:hypothetical protein